MTRSPALDPWRRDVAAFVQAHLPAPPAGILEVGCGDGWLCHHLADAAYEAQGIDPEAPDDPLLTPVGLESFDRPGSFDAVVATLLEMIYSGQLAAHVQRGTGRLMVGEDDVARLRDEGRTQHAG